jgi:hypothetical protein
MPHSIEKLETSLSRTPKTWKITLLMGTKKPCPRLLSRPFCRALNRGFLCYLSRQCSRCAATWYVLSIQRVFCADVELSPTGLGRPILFGPFIPGFGTPNHDSVQSVPAQGLLFEVVHRGTVSCRNSPSKCTRTHLYPCSHNVVAVIWLLYDPSMRGAYVFSMCLFTHFICRARWPSPNSQRC